MARTEPDQICFSRIPLETALRDIENLAELKVVLHVGFQVSATGRAAIDLRDLLRPETATTIAGAGSPRPAPQRVVHAVERAVVNGHLLRVRAGNPDVTLILPATTENRDLVARLSAGDEDALKTLELDGASDLAVYRPNAYALFERYIGPLTPLVAEHIRSAERAYPREWVEEAIALAAAGNHRSWRYIEAILVRWERAGGRGHRATH